MQIEEPPARSSGYVSSPPSDECFLCCDDRPGGLVSRVCLCRGVSMHLECQRRMLETAYAAQESSTLDTVLRCGVCHARYSNADARAVWRPSLLGYMWAMCCCGVVIMGLVINIGPRVKIRVLHPTEWTLQEMCSWNLAVSHLYEYSLQ